MKTESKNGVKSFYARTRKHWREWLKKNGQKESSVWLIIYKKDSGTNSVTYQEAVEEALCFGWIDSKPNKRDNESYYQFFAKRNPKSQWSKKNKLTVELLIKDGRMDSSGLKAIEHAKQMGTWTALDEVESCIIPGDLQQALALNKTAEQNFNLFPRSARKIILGWVASAKREETRRKRIKETVALAAKNLRANHYRQ